MSREISFEAYLPVVVDMEPLVRHHWHVEDTNVRAMPFTQLHVAQDLPRVVRT